MREGEEGIMEEVVDMEEVVVVLRSWLILLTIKDLKVEKLVAQFVMVNTLLTISILHVEEVPKMVE